VSSRFVVFLTGYLIFILIASITSALIADLIVEPFKGFHLLAEGRHDAGGEDLINFFSIFLEERLSSP